MEHQNVFETTLLRSVGSDSQVLSRNLDTLSLIGLPHEAKLVRSLSLPADGCKFPCWMHGY